MSIIQNINKKTEKVTSQSQGYTLVEMAIALIILSIFMVGAIQVYNLYHQNEITERTKQSVSRAATAVFEYKNAHGRFPCPSPIKELRTSPNYGHETDCADPNIGTASIINPGECLNGTIGPDNYDGICVEASNRLIAGIPPRIRVGSIPFRELQIDERDTIDGYGSRLVYAVTEDMANSATFNDAVAGIELRDSAGNILSGNDQSVAFLILSPGPNKNGAVSQEGTVSVCNTAATMLDAENCRDFSTATNTQSVYVMDVTSEGTGVFDDLVEYFVPTESQLWRRETPTSENIVDMGGQNIGVGTQTPADITDTLSVTQSTVNNTANISDTRLLAATNTTGGAHQSGALRVGKYNGSHSGEILADQYCDETGTLCFSAERIAAPYDGNPTTGTKGMGCPTGEYMVGIGSDKAICAPIRIYCPPGQAVTGFWLDGSPKCTTPAASCAAETVTLCSTSHVLAPGGNGTPRHLDYLTGGACAYANYTCNNGTWVLGTHYDTVFACTFTTAAAPTSSTSGVACAAGYTGTYTQNKVQNCLGNWINTTNTASTDCTCVGKTDTSFCPASFGGAAAGHKTRECTGNVLNAAYTIFVGNDTISYPTEAAMLAANCLCGKTDGWEFASCGAGKVRKASPTPASFVGPVDSWPAAADKGQYRKRSTNMATCTYSYAGWDSTNCECAAGYNWVNVNPTCPACQTVDTQGTKRQIRSGAGCGWIDDPDTSANTTGTCKPINYIWKSSGVVAGPSTPLAGGHGVSPVCTSSCLCSENGSAGVCAIATATEWTYYQSTCQPN